MTCIQIKAYLRLLSTLTGKHNQAKMICPRQWNLSSIPTLPLDPDKVRYLKVHTCIQFLQGSRACIQATGFLPLH